MLEAIIPAIEQLPHLQHSYQFRVSHSSDASLHRTYPGQRARGYRECGGEWLHPLDQESKAEILRIGWGWFNFGTSPSPADTRASPEVRSLTTQYTQDDMLMPYTP